MSELSELPNINNIDDKDNINQIDIETLNNIVSEKCAKLERLFDEYENFNETIENESLIYQYNVFGDKFWFSHFKTYDEQKFDDLVNNHQKLLNTILPKPVKLLDNKIVEVDKDEESTSDKIESLDAYHEKLKSFLDVLLYMKQLYLDEEDDNYIKIYNTLLHDINLIQDQIKAYKLLQRAMKYLLKLEISNKADCLKFGV